MEKRHHPPSYYRYQAKWRGEHIHINIFVPPRVKMRIDDIIRTLESVSITKWCSDAFLSLFSESNQRGSVIEPVIRDQMIVEGMEKFREKYLKKSLTGEICKEKDCGGRMMKLSYPTQKKDEKIEIRTTELAVCEKCGSIEEG